MFIGMLGHLWNPINLLQIEFVVICIYSKGSENIFVVEMEKMEKSAQDTRQNDQWFKKLKENQENIITVHFLYLLNFQDTQPGITLVGTTGD